MTGMILKSSPKNIPCRQRFKRVPEKSFLTDKYGKYLHKSIPDRQR
jgi:hypothetical protein